MKNSNNIIITPYKIVAIKYLDEDIKQYFCLNSIIQDFIINNSVKSIQANKKYILKSGIKFSLEPTIKSNTILYTYSDDEIYNLNQVNNTFENDMENLKLISDSNTFIYIFHKIKNDSALHQFPFKKEYLNKKVLILEETDSKYYYGYGYENYEPTNLIELKDYGFKMIYNPYQNIQIPNDYIYAIYSEEINYLFYNLDETFNVGKNILKSNNYISTWDIKSPNNKKNLFYQYIECEIFNEHKFNLVINGKDNREIFFSLGEYINNVENLSLYYHTNEASIFNFYFTDSDLDSYQNLNRNYKRIFHISFINRTLIKIEILPIYVDYSLDYYFIYKIQNNSSNNEELNNICYIQKIIENEINENYRFEKITLKGENYRTILLNTTYLEDNYTIYSNIFVEGNILDNINELTIYEAKSHFIQSTDFPESYDPETDWKDITDNGNTGFSDGGELENNNGSNTTTILLATLIPSAFILGIIIFFIVIKIRRRKMEIENTLETEKLCEMTDK